VLGLALWAFGARVRSLELRLMGAALLAAAVIRELVESFAHREPFVPLLNTYALPALAVVGCLLACAWVAWRLGAPLPPLTASVGLAGVALLWVVLSVEAYSYFATRAEHTGNQGRAAALRLGKGEEQDRLFAEADERQTHLERTALAAVSVTWAAYAAALLAAGFRLRLRPVRWVALGLFGLTLMKVVLFDTAHLEALYRAAVFFVLALMMAAGAWWYQKVARGARVSGKAGEASREVG
jgi:uncharacterized membrane protein